MRFGYLSQLEKDTRRWVEAGLISSGAAEGILADARSRKRGYSFSTIVIVLGVACLCFAAMTFVAANWEEIPRIMRLSLLVAAMWAAYVAATFATARGHPRIADALVLLGCGMFGASIMLVGQMYHLQGNASDAVLVWAGGTLIAAVLLRSTTALCLSIILFGLWYWLVIWPQFSRDNWPVDYRYLATWLVSAIVAWWLSSRVAAHLLALGLLGWVATTILTMTARDESLIWFVSLYALTFLLLAALFAFAHRQQLLRGFENAAAGYLILAIFSMSALWVAMRRFSDAEDDIPELVTYIELVPAIVITLCTAAIAGWAYRTGSEKRYDLAFCVLWPALAIFLVTPIAFKIPFSSELVALGFSIWLIRMGGRQEIGSVTSLGYLAFALVMLLIYFRTAGTLLGSTGFYLVSGVVLVAAALIAPRLMRMIKGAPTIGGEGSAQ